MTDDPNAQLEDLIAQASENEEALTRAVEAILDAVLVIPSGGDVTAGSAGFAPVLIPIDGVSHVAVFTSADGLTAVSHLAPYAMTMPGRTFVQGLGAGYGLLVAGRRGGFAIAPDRLASIRAAR